MKGNKLEKSALWWVKRQLPILPTTVFMTLWMINCSIYLVIFHFNYLKPWPPLEGFDVYMQQIIERACQPLLLWCAKNKPAVKDQKTKSHEKMFNWDSLK